MNREGVQHRRHKKGTSKKSSNDFLEVPTAYICNIMGVFSPKVPVSLVSKGP